MTSRNDNEIGAAVIWLKNGGKITRTGWNGKDLVVYYVPAASYPAQRNSNLTQAGEYHDDMVPYAPYLALKSPNGIITPWAPSVSDTLATDYILLD